MNNIFIEMVYECKCTRRNILFGIFILAVVGLVIYQFTPLAGIDHFSSINDLFHFSMDKISQAFPSSIAYKTAYYFNIIQLFFVVSFLVNDSRSARYRMLETLHSRPLSNGDIVIGNFLGKWLVFTLINFLTFVISILINVIFYPRSFEFSMYVFYWATLNLPTLVYSLGISYLVTRFVRHQGFSIMILLAFLGITIYWGAGWLSGLFDPCARYTPSLFSDFTGHVNLGNYLLQRGFILLAGGGFLVLSIIPYPRIPNDLFTFRKNTGMACVLFVLAGGLALVYYSRQGAIDGNREAYKRVYEEQGKFLPARMVRNDLHVKELENGDILVRSEMNVTNPTTTTIPLVIYLNPGLQVTSLEIGGKATSFRRDHQALLVDKELRTGENVEVSIDYAGHIANDICFLDTDPEKYNSTTVNSIGIYRFGYSPAFCEKGYKLLTPECIWYPACVPPYGESGIRDVNFSRYSLLVEHDSRLTAISPGNIIEEREGTTRFSFDHDMPGISLCIGNYKKRTITVDSTRLAFYYLPKHDYLVAGYDFPEDTLLISLEGIKSGLENDECIQASRNRVAYKQKSSTGEDVFDPTQHYPYRWLTLLEVPCSFHCFPGIMQPTGERVQGGIVFLPEKVYSIKNYPREIPENVDEKMYMLMIGLELEIKEVMGKGSCSIRPMFRGKTTFISSPAFPILHDVFSHVVREGFVAFTSPVEDYPAVEYLNRNSLKDALHDKSLSPGELESIIRKKSEELYLYISLLVGKEGFRHFYLDFLAANLFKETTQEECFRQFYQTFGFRLDSLVESWYHANRLALLEIRDAKAIKIGETDDDAYVLYSFKVFNRSDVPGLVATDDYQGWVIPPREGREIRTRDRNNMIYKKFFVGTPLTQNLPAMTQLKFEEARDARVDTTTGVFSVDPSLFSPVEDEDVIIVDNEDPGFRVVKPENFMTSLFHKKKSRKEYYEFVTQEDIWFPLIKEHFYGFPVRSALLKNAGSGKQKVEWNASLPRGGKYEVFFYYTTFSGESRESKVKESRYYTIFDGQKGHEVIVTTNNHEVGDWISLGVFDFSKDAKVILSDRGENEKYLQEFIIDAVKWVKVKE